MQKPQKIIRSQEKKAKTEIFKRDPTFSYFQNTAFVCECNNGALVKAYF